MNLAEVSLADLLGMGAGFLLTLAIFSYLLGNNFFFRTTIHLFIGVAAGFAFIVAFKSVIIPQLLTPILVNPILGLLLNAVPLILSGLMVLKLSPKLASLGNPSMAFLVGVGSATLVGGVIQGTLFPQVLATINLFDLRSQNLPGNLFLRLFEGVIILAGTISTLVYFHFGTRSQPSGTARRLEVIEITSMIGQVFLATALGVILAGVLTAALVAFVERLGFILQFARLFIQ